MIKKERVLTIGLNPAIQKTIVFKGFQYGEVNRSQEYYLTAAGKSVNVCRVLQQLGKPVVALSPVGCKSLEQWNNLGALDQLKLINYEIPGKVRTCITLVDQKTGEATELVVNEPPVITPQREEAFLEEAAKEMARGYTRLVLSGSKAAGFSTQAYSRLVRAACAEGIFVMADFTGEDLRNTLIDGKTRPDVVKINKLEFFQTFGEGGSLEERVQKLSREYNNSFVISDGTNPILAVEGDRVFHKTIQRVPTVNSVGCGDSMTAGILHGLMGGLSLEEALETGIRFGALNAMSLIPGSIKEGELV